MNLRIAAVLPAFFCALAASAVGLGAQDYVAKLRPISDVVLSGSAAELVLTIDVTKDCAIPAALVSGLALNTTVDGKRGPKITDRVSGKVKLLAGTKLVRPISVGMDRIIPNLLNKKGVTRVTFEWAGLKEVAATINIAPDLKSVKITDLDLGKTKVLIVTNADVIPRRWRRPSSQ